MNQIYITQKTTNAIYKGIGIALFTAFMIVMFMCASCSSPSSRRAYTIEHRTELERFNALPRPLVVKEYAFANSSSQQHVILQHNDSVIIFQGNSILVDYLIKHFNVGDTIK